MSGVAVKLVRMSNVLVPNVLVAKGLVKRYRRGLAVDHVDLTVREGERVALLGPNGAGKTTTLLMCLGAVRPDTGTVEIVGRRLPKGRSAAMAQIGFTAGYLPLPDRIRVSEYLRMYGQLYGLRRPQEQVARGLERFGIPHLAAAMGTELSAGQKTLIGIVKATMHTPRLLVLDEGTALLVTSHNMLEVERIAERVVFLARGRVVADGPPAEVAASFGQDDLEELFLHLAQDQEAQGAPGAGRSPGTSEGARL